MWPYPRIIAHRGAGILAPENTLAAMREATRRGYRGVEFDVMLTQDAVPVLMHDAAFGRTIPGLGSVATSTAAQLQAMDAGAWHSVQFQGEPVALLEDVVRYCRAESLWMNVELKPSPEADVETGAAVARCLATIFDTHTAMPALTQAQLPLLSSFSMAALRAARDAAPELPRALLVERLPPEWQALCQQLGVVAVHLNQRHVQQAEVTQLHAAGLGVFCYTVNEVARAHLLLEWGVDGFCTDRLDLIRSDFGA
jgi:glycerophosphoryl diester phosphodiesterase